MGNIWQLMSPFHTTDLCIRDCVFINKIIVLIQPVWCYALVSESLNVSVKIQNYVIIFLYVKCWIRLGTVSYRGKKVRTVDSPAVRSANKSRDTRNCVQDEPKYAICVFVATRLYYKALGIILCALIKQITPQLQSSWRCQCEVTVHRKMSALCTTGAMVTTHENSVMMWLFEGQNCLASCKTYWNGKECWVSHYGVVYKLNLISNLRRISDWSVHSGSYFFHSTGTFAVSTDSPLRR